MKVTETQKRHLLWRPGDGQEMNLLKILQTYSMIFRAQLQADGQLIIGLQTMRDRQNMSIKPKYMAQKAHRRLINPVIQIQAQVIQVIQAILLLPNQDSLSCPTSQTLMLQQDIKLVARGLTIQ